MNYFRILKNLPNAFTITLDLSKGVINNDCYTKALSDLGFMVVDKNSKARQVRFLKYLMDGRVKLIVLRSDGSVVRDLEVTSASIIQRRFRQWRNREHKYFAVQAVAEYFGHPKRIQFYV